MPSSKIFVALLAAPALLAFAPQEEEGTQPAVSAEAALQSDAASYARSFNVSQAEAERRLRIMHSDAGSADSLDAEYGDDFAGAYFDNQDFALVVRTTRTTGQNRTKTVRGRDGRELAVPVRELAGSPRNYAAIRNIVRTQASRLARQIEGVQGLGYDPASGEIVVHVYSATQISEQQVRQLGTISGIPTRIERLPAPIEDNAVRGGGSLGGGDCTTGFSATRGTVSGVVTAAHCANSYTYTDPSGASHTLPSTGTANPDKNANFDIQFMTATGVTFDAKFYADNTTALRDVTGRRLRSSTTGSKTGATGNYICHYGKTTGQSCGTVYQIDYKPEYAGACGTQTCNDVFVTVKGPDLACSGGDSGGPWFAWNTAWGINKGGSSTGTNPGDCSLSIYSSTDWLSSIGATLKTV